jgi:hypothetical protein
MIPVDEFAGTGFDTISRVLLRTVSCAEAKNSPSCSRSMIAVVVFSVVDDAGTVPRFLFFRKEPMVFFSDFKLIVGVGLKDESRLST